MPSSHEKIPEIPCVDIGKVAIKQCIDDVDDKEEWLRVGQEFTRSFEEIGFAYIKNHGIPEEMVEKTIALGSQFFDLDDNVKAKYAKDLADNHGFVELNRERLNETGKVPEIRECFDVSNLNGLFPSEVGEWKKVIHSLADQLRALGLKLLRCLEIGLGLPKGILLSKHMMVMTPGYNPSMFRILHYPPISEFNDETMRIGVHSDYGTITFVLQDNHGGLEAKNREGVWVKAPPIPGTILVNAGDFLDKFTNGKLPATKHRILVPEDEKKRYTARRSLVYFLYADNEILFEPMEGSDSSEEKPLTSSQYIMKRFAETTD